MSTTRIVIIDDHELLRAGLQTLLSQEPDLEVVGEAADGRSGLRRCRELLPDVAVVDLRLPDVDGVEVCRTLHEEMPAIAVLMLSTFGDAEYVLEAVKAGATGYVVKDVAGAELKRAIRAVARGEVAMDPKVVGHIVNQMRAPREEQSPLNRQQVAIVRLVAQGYTNREIAEQMFLSEKTVKGYLAEAMRRLEVKNRVEAAMVATKNGWI